MEEIEPRARLGIDDKRHLFATLLALVERLFMLNKFPVDQEDFALSLQDSDVEDAWRLLNEKDVRGLDPVADSYFRLYTNCDPELFLLHLYPDDKQNKPTYSYGPALTLSAGMGRVFIPLKGLDYAPPLGEARRHGDAVLIWAERQMKLERQMLRAIKVIKAIVHSCNTVGQYKRVSPDLLTFLPDKYKLALKDYTKKSPYPAMTIEPEEIETTMATLAYAALQPMHYSEEQYIGRPGYSSRRYRLAAFPRTYQYDQQEVRLIQL